MTARRCRERAADLRVAGTEPVGPYTLLRRRGGADRARAIPGQFFMLAAARATCCRGRCRSASPATASSCFLIDPIGPGTRALCALEPGDALHVLGPLGNGFDLDVAAAAPRRRRHRHRAAPVRWRRCSATRPRSSASAPTHHAEAAALLPGAEVVVEPDARHRAPARRARSTCSRAARSRCSRPCAGSCPDAQLAWEAPMACGYGACYGCVVEIDGRLQRLCVAGPVLRAA